MKPLLISFKRCPFVQKAILVLLYKEIAFDIEYIDLENPPDWFVAISPLGKVPVLKIGNEILFESSVIVEYLDEVYGNPLHPADALLKAQNRSWMEFGNECLFNGFNLATASDETSFNEQKKALLKKLEQLEAQLGAGKFFNGDIISLVDLSFAPFFQRQQFIAEFIPGLINHAHYQKVTRWSDNLLKLPQMAASTVPEIKTLYLEMIKKQDGYAASLMG